MLKRILLCTFCLSLSLPALAEITLDSLKTISLVIGGAATFFNAMAAVYAKQSHDDLKDASDFEGRMDAQNSQKVSFFASAPSAGLTALGTIAGATLTSPAFATTTSIFYKLAYMGEWTSFLTNMIALAKVYPNKNVNINNFIISSAYATSALAVGLMPILLARRIHDMRDDNTRLIKSELDIELVP